MPPQTTTENKSLTQLVGNKLDAAFGQHAKDPTNYGFQDLPPGIQNGVAQLTKMYFSTYKSGDGLVGQPYFRAEGVVLLPKEHPFNGTMVKVEKRVTSVQVPMCDTKKQNGEVTPAAEHSATVLNHLRMLGAKTEHVKSAKDVEAIINALVKSTKPIYFKFSTSPRKDQKTGQVVGSWQNWHGSEGLTNFTPNGVGITAGVQDSSAPAPAAAPAPRPQPAPAPVPEAQTEETQTIDVDQGDLDSLLALADQNNVAAQKQLTDMALGLGITQEAIDGTGSWTELVDLMRANDTASEGDASAEDAGVVTEEAPAAAAEEEFLPKKGDVFGYRPIDAKTKKPSKTQVEMEITGVNTKGKTVDGCKVGDKKVVYKGVKWEALETPE